MVDLEGRLQLVNDAFAEVLGSTSDKLVGKLTPEILYPEEAADFRRLLPELLSGARELLSVERHLRHADGHFIPGRLYVTAIHGSRGLSSASSGSSSTDRTSRAWRNSSSTKNSTTR